MLGYLSANIMCSKKRTVFQERSSRKTVSYKEQGQIFEHLFTPNGGYCVYYPSNLFAMHKVFRKLGDIIGYAQVLAVGIFSHVTCLDQLRGSEKI